MSQSQGKPLRLSTQKKRHLQVEVQCVCWSLLPSCVDLQPQIVCPSRQALRLLWQLGMLLKILPPWSGACLILWKNRRGGKGIEEVFVSCLWFVLSTKSPQSLQSEWFTLLVMNKVSALLFCSLHGFVCITAWPSGYLMHSKIPNPGWKLLLCG